MANVCVITGGGSGIGLATAKQMPKEKIIVLTGRTEEKLAAAEQELTALGYEARHIVCDVTVRRDVHELCLFAKSLGTIKTVIHCAAVSPTDPGVTLEDIVRVNAVGTKNVNMEFRKYMDEGGVIVDIASCSAYLLPEIAIQRDVYALAEYQEDEFVKRVMREIGLTFYEKNGFASEVSKCFVIWYAQKCAFEYAKDGIRVVSVSPGLVATETGIKEAAHAGKLAEHSAEGRIGTPEEVGFAIASVADERNSFLAGVDIVVDGGAMNGKRFKV